VCFPDDFHFFFGVSVFLKRIDMWDEIKSDVVGKVFYFWGFSRKICLGIVEEFLHSFGSGSTGSLVGGHNDFLDPIFFIDWIEHHCCNSRGTIGICYDFCISNRVKVDLRNDQRNRFIISKS